MLIQKEACDISKLMKERDIFPEAKEHFTRTLFDYYRELLANTKVMQIPPVRRMW